MDVLETLDISPCCSPGNRYYWRQGISNWSYLEYPWMCPDLFYIFLYLVVHMFWQRCQFHRFRATRDVTCSISRCGSFHLRPAWFEARGSWRSLERWFTGMQSFFLGGGTYTSKSPKLMGTLSVSCSKCFRSSCFILFWCFTVVLGFLPAEHPENPLPLWQPLQDG